MQRGLHIRRVAAVVALLVLVGGCGPITYVNQVTRKASAAVEEARAARAETYSPYWYTLAVEYLQKAREEAASADYEAANRFGRKAQEAAETAKKEAIDRAADPSDTAWLPPPSLREKSASSDGSPDDPIDGAGDGSSDPSAGSPDSASDPDSDLAPVIQGGDTAPDGKRDPR